MSYEQMWAVAVTSIITGIVGYLFGFVKDATKKYKEETAHKEMQIKQFIENDRQFKQFQEEILKQNKELKSQIESLQKKIEEMNGRIDLISAGGKVILRDRIIQSCRHFINLGHITLTAKSNISDMYHWYHDIFGGNGLGETYFKKMESLPVSENAENLVVNSITDSLNSNGKVGEY